MPSCRQSWDTGYDGIAAAARTGPNACEEPRPAITAAIAPSAARHDLCVIVRCLHVLVQRNITRCGDRLDRRDRVRRRAGTARSAQRPQPVLISSDSVLSTRTGLLKVRAFSRSGSTISSAYAVLPDPSLLRARAAGSPPARVAEGLPRGRAARSSRAIEPLARQHPSAISHSSWTPGGTAPVPFDVGARISDNLGRNSTATDRVPAAELPTCRTQASAGGPPAQPEESR